MTTRSETASRQNHLFVVSKQACSELSKEEGLNHTSSCLHSDSNPTRGGWFQFDRGSRAASVSQRGESKLVEWVATTDLSGYLLLQWCNSGSLFNIYCKKLINTLSPASIISDRSECFKLSLGGSFKLQIILSSVMGTVSEHVLQLHGCLHGSESIFKDKRLQNFKPIYTRSYQTACVKPLISRLITQRDNMKVNQMMNMANTDLFSPLAIVRTPNSW